MKYTISWDYTYSNYDLKNIKKNKLLNQNIKINNKKYFNVKIDQYEICKYFKKFNCYYIIPYINIYNKLFIYEIIIQKQKSDFVDSDIGEDNFLLNRNISKINNKENIVQKEYFINNIMIQNTKKYSLIIVLLHIIYFWIIFMKTMYQKHLKINYVFQKY